MASPMGFDGGAARRRARASQTEWARSAGQPTESEQDHFLQRKKYVQKEKA